MLPLIPKDLLDELNRRFPINHLKKVISQDLIWRGGQHSVIEFLNTIFEEQEASRLGE